MQTHPTFDVQVPLPPHTPEHQMLSSSSLVPLTTRSENDEETDSDWTDTDKRDPKKLTFYEYVGGDAGHVDGDDNEETPDYNYDEVNAETAERDKQTSRLITEG